MKKKPTKSFSSVNHNHNSVLDTSISENVTSDVVTSKPSHELLLYYKNKASRLEKEWINLTELLGKMKATCEADFHRQSELKEKNNEIFRLQQMVSDLQVHLYKEREQKLELSAENDKLKIKEFENRKKMDILLSISGTSHKELLHFVSNHPKAFTVPQKLPPKLQKLKNGNINKAIGDNNLTESCQAGEIPDPQVLILKNQSLAAQLEHHISISHDQIQALLKDKALAFKERQAERERLIKETSCLSSKLKKVQNILGETTEKLINRQEAYEKEREMWIEEKDKYAKMVKMLREQLHEVHPDILGYSISGVGTNKVRICGETEKIKEQIVEKEQLAAMYQEQILGLEAEVNRLKERAETCRNLFKEKTQKLSAQVVYLKSKYEDLDRRRLLEAEGFRTDIKMLRERLKELEKKLAKSNVSQTLNTSEQQLLTSARNTLNRARQLEKELTNIKSKIATLEADGDRRVK